MSSLTPPIRRRAPLVLNIAIAMLKTKPQGISARDYITSLRPYISSVPDQPESLLFDAAGYWKDLYSKASEGVDELESQLTERDFEIEQLKSRLAMLKDAQINTQDTREVVIDCLPIVFDLPEPKDTIRKSPRKRKIAEVELEPEVQVEDDLQSLHTLIGKQSRDLLLRNIQLRKLVEENNAFLVLELALEMQRTIAAVVKLLDRPTTSRSDGDTLDDITFRLIKLTISHVFRAYERLIMHRLSPDLEAKNPLGAVTYSVVELFKACMSGMGDAARAESDTSSTRSNTTSFGVKTSSARSSRRHDHSQQASQYQCVMTTILSSASHMVPSKSTKNPVVAYQELLEGLQYLLMTRSGSLLQVLTFGEESQGSIEKNLQYLANTKATPSEQFSIIAAAQVEAHYILPLVKTALAATTVTTKKQANTKLPQSMLHRCMTTAQLARLQRTVTQGIFGVSAEDELEDLLRLPAKVNIKAKGAQSQRNEDRGAWFVKAMWELVGWDFLEAGM